MPKLAVIATIEVVPGRREEYLAILKAHREVYRRHETGILAFQILCPRDDDTKVMLYELYADEAAFEAHFNGPARSRLREATAAIVVKRSGILCTPR
jgi:(4S)-4-hydroxy-5-phosphonooxypentane-2,3-dione isomerase